jgi:signal transduction histidine kinase/HAMP domain-containing protein
MLGFRQKLSIGFGGLLLIVFLIGFHSIREIADLGGAIDVILKENYRSVIACEEMKGAMERVDEGVQLTLLGYHEKGSIQINENIIAFEKALEIEWNNITLPGESEKAARLKALFDNFKQAIRPFQSRIPESGMDQEHYSTKLLHLSREIQTIADEILKANQQNMLEANDRARKKAAMAQRQMYLLLLLGFTIASLYVIFMSRWILLPITRLTRSVEEIKQGNLDLVVKSDTKDEIGHLSESFNEMAAVLRELRRNGRLKLIRTQRAAQQIFDSLPDAIAVMDLQGRVELSTESARVIFGLHRDVRIQDLPFEWIGKIWKDVVETGRKAELSGPDSIIQKFLGSKERFFHPQAVPILDQERQLTGIILILRDITQQKQQDDLKKGVISTVSHQLKTPLTSIRMAVHLLLDEKIGQLAEKQVELLVSAREESERLSKIIEDLLDIGRIETEGAGMHFHAVPARAMVIEIFEFFRGEARNRGIALITDLPEDLPEVWVDIIRIRHVFGNLLSNAFRYTGPGGSITLAAQSLDRFVRFSVKDTGRGIPSQYLPRIFERFFRVPDQEPQTGAGLGLAIVKEIIDAHGGTVQVESREGEGSTFSFTLKRADFMPEEEDHD